MISRRGRYLLADSTSQCITSAPFSQCVKGMLATASAILVAGVSHMGAWLRWPGALIADKDAHEAMLGADHFTELSRGYPRVWRVSTGSDG